MSETASCLMDWTELLVTVASQDSRGSEVGPSTPSALLRISGFLHKEDDIIIERK